MISSPPEGFSWPANWEPILIESTGNESHANNLAAELQHEASPAHPLYRIRCSAIAIHRYESDNILFSTAHPDMPLACVHLTWKKEIGDMYPWVEGYESWEAFRLAWAEFSSES